MPICWGEEAGGRIRKRANEALIADQGAAELATEPPSLYYSDAGFAGRCIRPARKIDFGYQPLAVVAAELDENVDDVVNIFDQFRTAKFGTRH